MGPHRKRQKLSDGGVAVPPTAIDMAVDDTPPSSATAEKKEKPRRSLFIKGLAPQTTTDDLTEFFSQSFPLKHATAVVDPSTQQCKGYGFVTFADAEDAQRAKEEFKDSELHGRKMRITVAEPRQRQAKGHVDAALPGPAAVKRAETKPKVDEAPRLIVRNLPWSIKSAEQLEEHFKPIGGVKKIILPTKPGTAGMLRGFAIVIMKKKKAAQTAIEKLSGKEIDGRTLAVDWAVDKSTWQNLQETNGDPQAAGDEEEQEASGEEDEEDENADEDAEEEEDDSMDVDMEDGSEADSMEDEDDEFDDEEPPATTLFVRNLPFSASDESLEDHFSQFGPVRYARIVIDRNLGIPKGTGFVCFYNEEDALECLKQSPKEKFAPQSSRPGANFSVLQNTENDPSGRYTLDGRVMQLSQAVSHKDAERLKTEGDVKRSAQDKDKRRLYLLNEGTISTKSPLYKKLSPTEISMREASVKQRKSLLQTNPSLNISLVRLAVRNIPRSIDSQQLKQLAREAIVGFATDVKGKIRQPLSKEELARGGEEMRQAELDRKKKAKGVVKQAKIVFEGEKGGKVEEKSGAGRSRGYGFIEFYTHRNALMALRWLNGHEVGYKAQETSKKADKAEMQDRKKRLIVEFAIENAQVVHRRKEREAKHRAGPQDKENEAASDETKTPNGKDKGKKGAKKDLKRKREDTQVNGKAPKAGKPSSDRPAGETRMIARNRSEKRAARKQRNGGK